MGEAPQQDACEQRSSHRSRQVVVVCVRGRVHGGNIVGCGSTCRLATHPDDTYTKTMTDDGRHTCCAEGEARRPRHRGIQPHMVADGANGCLPGACMPAPACRGARRGLAALRRDPIGDADCGDAAGLRADDAAGGALQRRSLQQVLGHLQRAGRAGWEGQWRGWIRLGSRPGRCKGSRPGKSKGKGALAMSAEAAQQGMFGLAEPCGSPRTQAAHNRSTQSLKPPNHGSNATPRAATTRLGAGVRCPGDPCVQAGLAACEGAKDHRRQSLPGGWLGVGCLPSARRGDQNGGRRVRRDNQH